jgi:hypothetical protein
LLDNEIIKRELIDSDEGGDASAYIKKLQKALNKRARRCCSPGDQSHDRSEAIRRLVELWLKAKSPR